MATEVRMPDIGTVEGEVTLIRWLKSEGDDVSLGEPFYEVETDKGVSEVESAVAGVVVRLLCAEGSRVASGEPIALVRRPGEPEESPSSPAAAPGVSTAAAGPAAPAPRAGGGPAARVTPAIQALADKLAVDLTSIRGTGPRGMITRQDVLAARGGPSRGPAQAGFSKNQAAVARAVSRSHRETPVFHVSAAVEMTRASAFRDRPGPSGAPSWDAILVKAVGLAVAESPLFRRRVDGDGIAEHPSVDIAVAVGAGEELFAPVVRGADAKGVGAISAEIADLAARARAHSLSDAEMEGGCFLVSNLGMYPIEGFDAILLPGQSAALAAGPAAPAVLPEGAGTRIAPVARLTLTVDHRVINGRPAAQFLSRVKQILEKGELE